MAVEKAKLIVRLKALFPKANLSKSRLDALADKLAKKPEDNAEDAAIDAVINDFNEIMDIESIAKEDDRVRSLETEKAKLIAEKSKGDKKGNPDPDKETGLPEDTPKWARALVDTNKKLSEEIESIKSGKATETKLQNARSIFDSSEVLNKMKTETKESWLKRIDLGSETSFEDQVKSLETEYSELVQDSADNKRYGGAAGTGSTSSAANQEVVDSVIDNMDI